MAQIEKYIPDFCKGIKKEIDSFKSLEELKRIGYVEEFKKSSQVGLNFYRYSVSKGLFKRDFENILIAEYNKGSLWLVIGYIDDFEIIKELPPWKKYEAKYEKKIN